MVQDPRPPPLPDAPGGDVPAEPDRYSADLPLEEPAEGLSGDFVTDVTQLYLNDVGQHALLTPGEELAFARAALFYYYTDHQNLHSLPTRRSSGIGIH